jgi:hypothetical protein
MSFRANFMLKIFFQNPYHLDTEWPTFKSLANGAILKQFPKSFRFFLIEPESSFIDPKLRDKKYLIHPKEYWKNLN